MKIRVGSRESKLAVVQSQIVIDAIRRYDRAIETELVTMKTTGDIILDKSIDKIGGKGLFTKELERALLNGEIDICVHSYKDVPTEENPLLPIVALSERENPFDVLVLPEGAAELSYNKPIGVSSKRRIIQMKQLDARAEFSQIRGNVLTRLKRLDSGEYGGLILAYAGLKRLGLTERIFRIFNEAEMIPAASQGILAVQGRKGDDFSYLKLFDSKRSRIISDAERSYIKSAGGGCSSPNSAYARLDGDFLTLTGIYVNEETAETRRGSVTGALEDAAELGKLLSDTIAI